MTTSNQGQRVPGAPSSEPPAFEEPTGPRPPLPPKDDQAGPDYVSPTGTETGAAGAARAQNGEFLTTAQGARLYETDHSLKAGARGPTLLQDHHLREKITHFDHERIPERVVHARGAAAHGVFRGYGRAAGVCRADFLREGAETPVFVRFSTVVGSRGSADTARDTRGFATKFYTSEGTFDLVGNNMPVFFIQDGIKFPDVIHAVKPQPDREIPQAQSAHDTFYDFVSLHTEATMHTMWNMSDRGLPRSYRMMEGFGIHTFQLQNADGETTLVKFHWKPVAGVHSVTWEEAQLLAGMDPDFHRRDLADAIESGAYPEWELGIQTFPDTEDQSFEGVDLLDPTKLVPEELAPVQLIGRMTLTANPLNYFEETEQVAFHPGHLVPGIDVTDDPLLQARLFSYLDTQISRLGGPNFAQLPINRPHAPVNDMFRDGMHQTAVHSGSAPYRPNSLDGGCPFLADAANGAYIEVPRTLPVSEKTRKAPASFDDHFSQPRMFWKSLAPVEKDHLVQAFTFELGKCYEDVIRQRELLVLANVDAELCAQVAAGLGMDPPEATVDPGELEPSPALSQLGRRWPVQARTIGILTGEGSDLQRVSALRDEIAESGQNPLVIAGHGGSLGAGSSAVPVQRTLVTTRSVEYDAILVAGAPRSADDRTGGAGAADPRALLLVEEAYRHCKAIGAWGEGTEVLAAAGADAGAAGIVVADDPTEVLSRVLELLEEHRAWNRFPTQNG